jgi:hypothetical protein
MSKNEVIFSHHKKRKYNIPYKPNDKLEQLLLENNNSKICVEFPTHISQRGGYYHFDSSLKRKFIEKWKEDFESNVPFYIVILF